MMGIDIRNSKSQTLTICKDQYSICNLIARNFKCQTENNNQGSISNKQEIPNLKFQISNEAQ